jgi:uncharacterized protein
MKPRINVITLAVSDLERSLMFYRDGLGLITEGIVGTEFDNGTVAFFKLEGDLILALYPRESLAKDADLAVIAPDPPGFSIGHPVATRQEVDEVLAQAAKAGARIPGPAHERPWGIYSGYFQDPDGHLWEVICNLQF